VIADQLAMQLVRSVEIVDLEDQDQAMQAVTGNDWPRSAAAGRSAGPPSGRR
jgi:hypothetical protein